MILYIGNSKDSTHTHTHTHTHKTYKKKYTSSAKVAGLKKKSTYKNQLHFYTLLMNNPKKILRKQSKKVNSVS